jgi:hypothetical protein
MTQTETMGALACGCPPGAHDDGDPGGFYVTVKDHGKTGWLAGPYGTHEAALADVADVKRVAEAVNDRAVFYAFGTARIKTGERPDGLLNKLLPEHRAAWDRETKCYPTPEAAEYMDRIRNEAKAEHARAVWDALCLGEALPGRPDGLSAMAGQAVEMRLAELARAKRDTRACVVCARPAQHANHAATGHTYDPAPSQLVAAEAVLAARRRQGRNIPRTIPQAKQARDGRLAAIADFPGNVRLSDDLIGSHPWWRSAYDTTICTLREREYAEGRQPHQWLPAGPDVPGVTQEATR